MTPPSGPIEAVIMAGGKGTRLLPFTAVMPKPLLPVGNAPVLERLLWRLRNAGLKRVCLAVHHHRQLIQAYFGDGRALGLEISYTVEERPLGTCGAIAQVMDDVAEHFLLMNADLVTDLDFGLLRDRHRRRGADMTMTLRAREVVQEFGVVEYDADGRVARMQEKPSATVHLNMGIYALRRAAAEPFVPKGQPMDVPALVNAMLAAGRQVDAFVADCLWLDIGRPDDYARAQAVAAEEDALMHQVSRRG